MTGPYKARSQNGISASYRDAVFELRAHEASENWASLPHILLRKAYYSSQGSRVCVACHENFGPGPKPVRGDHFWRPKLVPPRTDFPAIIGPPVPKVVLPSISVKRAAIMPPNVSKYDYGRQGVFQRWRRGSRRPDRGGLRLHDSKALPCRMYGRTKTKHKEKGSKVCCEGWGAILQEEAERQGQLSGNEARTASFILASVI